MLGRTTRRREKKLRFEVLERRTLLSAAPLNAATLKHHNLLINGTDGNDVISVTESAGIYSVTINGATTTFAAAGVRNLKINTLGGSDVVNVGTPRTTGITSLPAPTLSVQRGLSIRGSGADAVTIAATSVGRKLDVRLGGGSDLLAVTDSTARQARLRTGAGADTVAIVGLNTARSFNLRSGGGGDHVSVVNTAAGLTALTTPGTGLLASYAAGFANAGLDVTPLTAFWDAINPVSGTLSFTSLAARNAQIRTGNGAATVAITGTSVAKTTKVDLDGSGGALQFTGNTFSKGRLDVGPGGANTVVQSGNSPNLKVRNR
jgi:hypothetical protein